VIIIPEIETVLILVPRTGSSALRAAIAERYPLSMMVYRHMEADGVPQGYDRWRRLGIVRHPVDRLWSLYRYLQIMEGESDGKGKWEPAYVARQRASADLPFCRWLVENEVVFTAPYDSAGTRFFPRFTVRHPLPENRKSQFIYLRPDLGTEVFRYQDAPLLHEMLDVTPPRINGAAFSDPVPGLTDEARAHIERYFAWDMAAVQAAPMDRAA
jgi:hypothetical protein